MWRIYGGNYLDTTFAHANDNHKYYSDVYVYLFFSQHLKTEFWTIYDYRFYLNCFIQFAIC